MGGSVIGLFGDFGDGWGVTTIKSGISMEAGGSYLNERNPDVFGLADGSQLWNQVKVGEVYRDKMYEGIRDLENFSVTQTADKRDLVITGIGLKITSKSGSVYNGIDGSSLSVRDVREYRGQNNKGYREISLGVERVGGFGESGERFTGSIDLSTSCVAWTDQNKNGMLIFAGVELSRGGKNGDAGGFTTGHKEKFVGLNGCEFFQWIGNQDIYLHKLGVGPGYRGNLFVLGSKRGVFDLANGKGPTKNYGYIGEIDPNSKAVGVALIGVVGDVLGFIGEKKLNRVKGDMVQVPECWYKGKKQSQGRDCDHYIGHHRMRNGPVDREWQARKGYTRIYQKFNRAALQNEHRFGDWLLRKAKVGNWFPKGTEQIDLDNEGIAPDGHNRIILLRGHRNMTSGDSLDSNFYGLLGGADGLKGHQRWSKTSRKVNHLE